jgi:hypothetical protein
MGRFESGQIFIMLARGDYWQCGYVIPKGAIAQIHEAGLPVFRKNVAALAPFVADRVEERQEWSSIKLLTVKVDRLTRWCRPGLLSTVTAVVFAALAAGDEVVWAVGRPGLPGPWRPLGGLPLIESVLPARLAMVVTVCGAVLLALAVHRLPGPRPLLLAALALVLVPIAPTPLAVGERPSVPRFFTAGQWREFVEPGHTLVAVPRPDGGYADPMRWQYVARFGFRINSGYFVGPAANGRNGSYYPPERPSETLALRAYRSGQPQPVTAEDRAAARADLRAWRADAVVLDPRLPTAEAVRDTVSRLYGVSERLVGGVWVWDVRALRAP